MVGSALRVFSIALLLSGIGFRDAVAHEEPEVEIFSDEFNFPVPSSYGKALQVWTTNYYVPYVVGLHTGPYALLDLNGKALGPKLGEENWCKGAFEGTIRIVNERHEGKTYNYSGVGSYDQVPCKGGYAKYPQTKRVRFKVSKYEFGEGVKGYALNPYRTIAVAPAEIPYGSILYIPQARGQTFVLPNGQQRTHDGYFYAADTGAAMRNDAQRPGRERHIDLFTGEDEIIQFPLVGNKPDIRFESYIVHNESIKAAFERSHKPLAAQEEFNDQWQNSSEFIE